MVAYKETWITSTSDFSSVNPDGRVNGISLHMLQEKLILVYKSIPSQMLIKNEGQNKDISKYTHNQEVHLCFVCKSKQFLSIVH